MKKLRVRYANADPYSSFKYGKDNEKILEGIVRDIYDGMKTFMGHFEYEPEYQPYNYFGQKLANGSFTGMIGATFNNETDISGPYQMNFERTAAVEFTINMGYAQIGIMSGMVPMKKHPFLLFSIFSLPVWITLLLSIVFMSAATTLVYRVLPSHEKRSIPEVFSKYFWAYQTSLLDESFGSSDRWFIRHVCNSPSFRLLQLIWFVGPGLVCLYSYQGGIISAFAANKFKPKISSIEELLKDTSVKVFTHPNLYTQRYYESLNGTRYASIWEDRMKHDLQPNDLPGTVPPWMDSVAEGKAIFTEESQVMRNIVGHRFLKTGKCGIRVSDIDLGGTYVAMAFRKEYHNTSILREFNRGLRRFTEGDLTHFRFLKSNHYYDICNGVNTAAVKPLNLTDLLGAFLVLTTGIVVSSIVFCVELLVSKKSDDKVSNCGSATDLRQDLNGGSTTDRIFSTIY